MVCFPTSSSYSAFATGIAYDTVVHQLSITFLLSRFSSTLFPFNSWEGRVNTSWTFRKEMAKLCAVVCVHGLLGALLHRNSHGKRLIYLYKLRNCLGFCRSFKYSFIRSCSQLLWNYGSYILILGWLFESPLIAFVFFFNNFF